MNIANFQEQIFLQNTSSGYLQTFTLISYITLFNFFQFPIFLLVMFTNCYRMTCTFPYVLVFLDPEYSKEHVLLPKLKESQENFIGELKAK